MFFPHHLYLGVLVAAVAVASTAWVADREGFPGVVMGALAGTWFSFMFVWPSSPNYHAPGALLCLVTLGAATAAIFVRRFWRVGWTYPRIGVAAGLLIAWDDIIDHALHVDTPLSLFFDGVLLPLMRYITLIT